MNIKITNIGVQRQLNEIDVTRANLKQIVEALHYSCETMPNGSLCVQGIDVPRPIWIAIDPEQNLITIEVIDWPPPYSDGKDLAGMLNTLNSKVGFVTFYVEERYLHGEYSFTYSDGLNVKHFVENVRRLSRTYDTAVANVAELRARD